MAVTRGGLQDRERDMRVENRDPGAVQDDPPAPPAPAEPEGPAKQATAAAFRARLTAARELQPAGARHWLLAWQQGRDAAVEALESGPRAAAVARARALQAPDPGPCRDCWAKGRDAVIALMVTDRG